MSSGILNRAITRSLIIKNFQRHTSDGSTEGGGGACNSEKFQKMAKKLREKTPIGKLDELEEGKHPFQEKEPLPQFPGGVNPTTGEIGGPRGPEPTRFGDWERKGRVSDF